MPCAMSSTASGQGQVAGRGAEARRRRSSSRRTTMATATYAAPGAGGRGRPGRHGSAYRPRARHGRRLLLSRSPNSTAPRRRCASRARPSSRFVYAAALDNGYTPASVIMDGPITIQTGSTTWTPKNYDGKAAGPSTLRTGIERSRNLMTVRLANDMGMKTGRRICRALRRLRQAAARTLPMALGSGETTVMRMVSAYSVMANGGRQIKPSLIDRIQDRYGKTVFKHDERGCEGCVATEWSRPAGTGTGRQFRAGARPDDGLPDHLDDGRRRPARHGDHAARTRPPDRRQDRHDQRREGRLVRRLHAEPRRRPLSSASTSRSRSARAPPAAALPRRSSRTS